MEKKLYKDFYNKPQGIKLMSSDIYNKIGKILIISALHDSKKIIAKIEIAEENDVGTYTFSAIDTSGEEKSYRPVSQARDDLFKAFLELK